MRFGNGLANWSWLVHNLTPLRAISCCGRIRFGVKMRQSLVLSFVSFVLRQRALIS
jgi:hypothetical protein